MPPKDQPFDALSESLYSSLQEPEESKLPRPLRTCPVCNSQTKWQGVDLVCDSPDCIGKLIKRIVYFYSRVGFNLHSIADGMIAKLILEQNLRRGDFIEIKAEELT